MTHQEIDELLLGLTSGDGWKALQMVLDAEGAASMSNELDTTELSAIMWQRGYRAGLAFAYNIREMTKTLIDNAEV